jgi:hypothetical protein
MRAPIVVRIAFLLTVATIVGACGSGEAADRPQASPSGSPTSFGVESVRTAMASLASIGVDVRTLPSDDGPAVPLSGEPSAVRLLRFQVRNMALELATGGGIDGTDLDAATVAGGGAPVTPLIAGWLASATTPAADLARSMTEVPDPAEPKAAVFPTLALAAFLADVARGGATEGAGVAADAQFVLMSTSQGGDLCSEVATYLDQVMADVVDPQAEFDVPWLESVIDQYAPRYRGDPELFRTTIGALTLLTYATSIARSWGVLAVPVPAQVAYSIEGEDPVEGEVQVTVEAGREALSDEVRACATLAGIELEGAPPDGASMFWDTSGLGPHAKATDADAEIDVDRAGITYETTAESAQAAQSGDPQVAEMSVLVIVDREEMRGLADAVAAILLGPAQSGPAASAVKALYLKMQPTLATMLYPRAVATIDVTFHSEPSPSPTVAADVVSGTWEGTWVNDLTFAGQTITGGFVLTLAQDGTRVTGTARFSGPTCVRQVPVDGTVRGSTVKLPMPSQWDIEFVGTVEGDSMSGTYSAIACEMPDFIVTGTWQAERR